MSRCKLLYIANSLKVDIDKCQKNDENNSSLHILLLCLFNISYFLRFLIYAHAYCSFVIRLLSMSTLIELVEHITLID